MIKFLKFIAKTLFPKWLLRLLIIEKRFEVKKNQTDDPCKGKTVFCPCCGKKFRRFMDFGFIFWTYPELYRENYKRTICPYCFSMPRHRIVCHYFNNNKVLPKGNIIMFGAEYSIKKWFDRNNYHYTTADLFDQSADLEIDIQNISLPDESFGLIICNHVLEHVPDHKNALKELRRILGKEGILVLTVPTNKNYGSVHEDKNITTKKDRIKYYGQEDHLKIFGNDFEKILIDAFFSVETINGDDLPEEIAGVIGPASYDDNRVYICRKK